MKLIIPKLPMRNKEITRNFYVNMLGFTDIGTHDYTDYLLLSLGEMELHFFLFSELNPEENYGQIYVRTDAIDKILQTVTSKNLKIHPLEIKPWGIKEFSMLDPDHNLITFGQNL